VHHGKLLLDLQEDRMAQAPLMWMIALCPHTSIYTPACMGTATQQPCGGQLNPRWGRKRAAEKQTLRSEGKESIYHNNYYILLLIYN
jgi:hypothetical protein